MHDAPNQEPSAAPWSRSLPSEPGMSTGERIVVVDDHAELAGTLAEVLGLDGFDVRTAADGASALAVIAEHQPICVLTDVDMPGMNGFELVQRLRELYGSDIVLIAITGWGKDSDCIAEPFDAFDHCLRKPIDLAFLRQLLRRA
jgi:CheY-like chemotaxis protein